MTIHFDRNMLNVPNPLFRIMEEEKKRIRNIEEKMMITINEIEKQLEVTEKEQTKLKNMINKLKSEANEVMNPKKETFVFDFPTVGTEVFFVNDYGFVLSIIWEHTPFQITMFKQRRIFYVEKEAELECKRREFMVKFNQFRDKCNGDWKPDFKTPGEKYYIVSEVDSNFQIGWCVVNNKYPKFGYFKDGKDCEKAIKLFGDEIKELF